MKKQSIKRPAIVLVAIICLFFIIILFLPKIDLNNFTDRGGLTSYQKIKAVYAALWDTGLDTIIISPGECFIGNVSVMDQNVNSGFIDTDVYARVPIRFGSDMVHQNKIVYVDLTDNSIAGTEWTGYRSLPISGLVKIPPGISWYHEITDRPVRIRMEIQPNNVEIISMILDENNFKKLVNGEQYTTEINRSGQCEFVIDPYDDQGAQFSVQVSKKYLVIKNTGTSTDAIVNFIMSPGIAL